MKYPECRWPALVPLPPVHKGDPVRMKLECATGNASLGKCANIFLSEIVRNRFMKRLSSELELVVEGPHWHI